MATPEPPTEPCTTAPAPGEALPRREGAGDPIAGKSVGRYRVIDRLGEGGMGAVYRAHDQELDRTIALKLVRPRRAGPDWAAGAAARLLREAKALARVSHPNVVAVHDAGTYAGGVFIAMELVDGDSLRAWLATPRTWRAVVAAFVAAGRGLAAAHAAGVIHRDFKPDNVMVGRDGRVRVLDFGLARALAGDSGGDPRGDLGGELVTQAGAVMGTPAYMAPEQLRGEAVDARTDVFGFCVALWEALYGELPFAAGEREARLAAIRAGAIVEPKRGASGAAATGEPRRAEVPAWVRDVARRGLRDDPAARWPSMAPLVAALEHDPAAARRRTAVIAAAAVLVLGGAGATVALARHPRTPAAAPCAGAARRWTGVWDDTRRAQVHAALTAGGRAAAEGAFAAVARGLDGYRAAWIAAQTEACEATHVHREQSAEVLDRRTACLERGRARAAALVDVFAGPADDAVLERAPLAVLGLPDLAACGDLEALAQALPPPADAGLRDRIAGLRTRLDHAGALGLAGRYVDGAAEAAAVDRDAAQVGWAPLAAEAALRHGALARKAGDLPAAPIALRAAIDAAADAHDDVLAAEAWIELLDLTGRADKHFDEAAQLRLPAEAAVKRAGQPPLLRASLLATLGGVLEEQGDLPGALALQEEARALREQHLPAGHPTIADSWSALASIANKQGRYEDAAALYGRVAELRRAALGPLHPDVAIAMGNVAAMLSRLGRSDEAVAMTRQVLALKEQAFGPDHPSVAISLVNLGAQLTDAGHPDDAVAPLERAVAIREHALGVDHADTASALNALGNARFAQRRFADAVAVHARALAIREKVYGPTHATVGQSLTNLAVAQGELGDLDAALATAQRAADVYRAAVGAEHVKTAQAEVNLADVYRRRGDPARALALLAHAGPIIGKGLGAEHPTMGAVLAATGACELALHHPARAIAPLEAAARILADAPEHAEVDADLARARAAVHR